MNTKLINNKHNTEQASKDLQTVSTQVSVQYSLNSSFTPQVYKKIGLESAIAQTLIEPAILESLKAVTAKYTAEELVTQRAKLKLSKKHYKQKMKKREDKHKLKQCVRDKASDRC